MTVLVNFFETQVQHIYLDEKRLRNTKKIMK